jgi:hypothetical protein
MKAVFQRKALQATSITVESVVSRDALDHMMDDLHPAGQMSPDIL